MEDNIFLKNKIHLFNKGHSVLNADDFIKLKKLIKENVKAPSKKIKIYIVKILLKSNDNPLSIIISSWTLTPKLAVIPEDDNIFATFYYKSKKDINNIGINEDIINYLINLIKNGGLNDFSSFLININDALINYNNEPNKKNKEDIFEYLKNTRNKLDLKITEYNFEAKKWFNEKMEKAKKIFEERKNKGEKMTKTKLMTIKKNVIKKNPNLKKRMDELLKKADDILEEFKELAKYASDNGLEYNEIYPYVNNIKMLSVE